MEVIEWIYVHEIDELCKILESHWLLTLLNEHARRIEKFTLQNLRFSGASRVLCALLLNATHLAFRNCRIKSAEWQIPRNLRHFSCRNSVFRNMDFEQLIKNNLLPIY